jgi:hypothetical protein
LSNSFSGIHNSKIICSEESAVWYRTTALNTSAVPVNC